MPFGFGKSNRRRTPALPADWIGWLEPGVEIEGKMTVASGLIRVNTHFKGEIRSEGMIVVHDQGDVEGLVYTRLISVTGKVKGNIHAHERLEIKEHGVVQGDIHTPCLVVDPGGFFDGHCHMPAAEPADAPIQSGADPKDSTHTT